MDNLAQEETVTYVIHPEGSEVEQKEDGRVRVLPSLSPEGEEELARLGSSGARALELIRMLGLTRDNQPDPELRKILDKNSREQAVRELYLEIRDDCEANGWPLFNRLSSWEFLEFLYPGHEPG